MKSAARRGAGQPAAPVREMMMVAAVCIGAFNLAMIALVLAAYCLFKK